MVNLTIDGREITVKENTTIMEAASQNGIPIPKLCYLKGINEIAACRVCVVELEGKEKLITSCNNIAKEGMVIHTNSPKVRRHRRTTVELILSQHDCECVTCSRSGNCSLQTVANDLNIIDIPFKMEIERQPWNKEFPLIRDSSKCIKCMRCVQVCEKVQGLGVWDVEGTGSRTTINVAGHRTIEEADCALCGQCITHCPTGALTERDETEKVWNAIADPEKIVVVQIAPAVRAAWGEELGLSREEATVGKIIDVWRRLGADYVFDTSFSADLTIMEEGTEFQQRFTSGELKDRPMFTSCCPGFVNMVRKHYPELADKISTTVSPMCAVSRMIKAKDPDAVTVFIGPCVAKKSEVHDQKIEGNADYVLTFSEIRAIMKAKGVQLEADDTSYQEGSVFGKRFANSGGVTAAVIESMKEKGEDVDCKVCKANGAAECKKALLLMKAGKLPENFIEGMACEGGCVGGPSSYNDMVSTKKFRDDLLSRADDRKIRDNIANYHMETFEMHRKEQ